MVSEERLPTVIKKLRQMSRFVDQYYDRSFNYKDRGQVALDQLRHDFSFLIDFATGSEREEPQPARGYRCRPDGLMVELQRVPDERTFDEMVLSREDLLRLGAEDDAAWTTLWAGRGFSNREVTALRSAFADLEAAWLVFFQSRDPDRALWRLIDAAGQIAELFPPERREATGRGYRVEKVPPHCEASHRWDENLHPRAATPPVPPAPRTARGAYRQKVRQPAAKPKPVSLDPRRIFSRLQKAEIFLRCNGCCVACGVELADDWNADHIYPHAWGGMTEVINGQALCQPCNQRKRDNILTVDGEEAEPAG